MIPRSVRWLLAIVLTLVTLEAAYVAVMSLLLNNGTFAGLLNRRAERVMITWDSARSSWPGDIEVQGLRIRAQGPKMQIYITAEAAHGRIDLFSLPLKIFEVHDLVGEGISFRLRNRLATTGPVDTTGATPDIPGISNPPDPDPDTLYPFPEHPWQILLPNLEVSDIQEVWIEDYRFEGAARAQANLDITPRTRIAIADARVNFRSGYISLDRSPVVTDLSGFAEVDIAPFAPGAQEPAEILAGLSARVAVVGEIKTLRFLNFYLRETPWFAVTGGEGDLETDVWLDHGDLVPGSRLEVYSDAIQADLKAYQVNGSGWVRANVTNDEGDLSSAVRLEFLDFRVAAEDQEPPLVQGEGLVVSAQSPDTRLGEPFTSATLWLDLPASEVPDLAAFNTFLPSGTDLRLGAGSGRLAGNLTVSTAQDTAEGEVDLSSESMQLSVGDISLRGRMDLQAHVSTTALQTGQLQIDGTRLALEGVSVRDRDSATGLDQGGWWAYVRVTRGTVVMGPSPSVEASVQTRFRDTGPIVSLFAEIREMPDWLQRRLTLDAIAGGAHVLIREHLVNLTDLTLSQADFELRARMRRSGASRSGILLLRSGELAVGLELKGREKDWKLRNAQRWFDEHPPL